MNFREQRYLKIFFKPAVRTLVDGGTVEDFLHRQGVINCVGGDPIKRIREFELSDWALEILEDDPSILEVDDQK